MEKGRRIRLWALSDGRFDLWIEVLDPPNPTNLEKSGLSAEAAAAEIAAAEETAVRYYDGSPNSSGREPLYKVPAAIQAALDARGTRSAPLCGGRAYSHYSREVFPEPPPPQTTDEAVRKG